MRHIVGIDVGTGSARAGVFDENGVRLGVGVQPIRIWRPRPGYAQQSSQDIWSAVGQATRTAMREAAIPRESVVGIGFDATCSLVLVGDQGQPVSIDPDGEPAQDVVVWMDHRAEAEAEHINAEHHMVLDFVGGRISPEMQTPKLMWLQRHLPDSWRRARHFFDLPDYLTYRATGSLTRSLCSTVCKWTYLGHESRGWDGGFFRAVGLDQLVDEGFERIGTDVCPMGEPLGKGLSADAAEDLGLAPGTAVGVSIIDAHAGGLGVLAGGTEDTDYNRRVALIGGTSSCHMAVSSSARYVEGVWGPYFSAMVPGLWLNEGGQSATGALIDRIVFGHPASAELQAAAEAQRTSPYDVLNRRLHEMAGDDAMDVLTHDLHVDPDFHGNRSPRADASLRGTIMGLRLEQGMTELTQLYLATIQAVAYGTRHILESLNAQGYAIDTLAMCGGGTKNPVFLQQHANATGCTIELPEEPEAVLLGSACLGGVAAGVFPDVPAAMKALTRPGKTIAPRPESAPYHAAKYAVYHRLHEAQVACRHEMSQTLDAAGV